MTPPPVTTKHSPGPWRVGRKVGRTIYDANDRLIGVMDHIYDARLVAAMTTEPCPFCGAPNTSPASYEQWGKWQQEADRLRANLAAAEAEAERLQAAAVDFNRLRQEAQTEARVLRAENERLEGVAQGLAGSHADIRAERDRLRAVLADAEGDPDWIRHAKKVLRARAEKP